MKTILITALEALEECYEAMQEEKELSPAEQKYKARLIEVCYQVIELHENLNS